MVILEITKLFEKFNVVYIDQPYGTFINLKTVEIDYNYFKQYTGQLVVINFSSENLLKFENHVYDQLSQTDINFLLLTSDHEQHLKKPRMVYFPYFAVLLLEVNKTQEIYPSVNKTYYLGCLNGGPRPHRIANFLKLRKKPYWSKTSMTFFKGDGITTRADDLRLTIDEINEWNDIKKLLPVPDYQGNDNLVLSKVVNLPQLVDSYLHLVPETTVSYHSVFITEKIWKPIAVGVPFVVLGNPGTMSFLKQQGVDIYDDIIDHKYYDTEKSAKKRLDKLHAVIDDLMLQGIDKIYNQLLDRVIVNQTKFFNAEFSQLHLSTLVDTIKQYK